MQPELLAVIHVSTACCVLQYYVRAQVNRSTSNRPCRAKQGDDSCPRRSLFSFGQYCDYALLRLT